MGETKLKAEKIVLGFNKKSKTKFACIRFGNVVGSRGSVIPLFINQIKKKKYYCNRQKHDKIFHGN